MAAGKQAARSIDERLMGESRWAKLFAEFEYNTTVSAETSTAHRHRPATCAAYARVRSNQEVVAGLTTAETASECDRCLRCDLRVTSTEK
jgi:hypothetical protein